MAHNNFIAQVGISMPKLEGLGVDPTNTPGTAFEGIISRLIGILTIVGILYFIFQIIFAGYSMLSSDGDPKRIDSARDRLTQGVLGLFVIMIAIVLGSLIAALAGINNPLAINELIKKLMFKSAP